MIIMSIITIIMIKIITTFRKVYQGPSGAVLN